MNNYKKLEIWKEGIELVSDVYKLVLKFPKEELFSLTAQIKRCSVSIPSNIAEGAGSNGKKEFVNFLGIACGSCCELDTQLILAIKLGYLNESETSKVFDRLDHIQRMSANLIKKLNEKEYL